MAIPILGAKNNNIPILGQPKQSSITPHFVGTIIILKKNDEYELNFVFKDEAGGTGKMVTPITREGWPEDMEDKEIFAIILQTLGINIMDAGYLKLNLPPAKNPAPKEEAQAES